MTGELEPIVSLRDFSPQYAESEKRGNSAIEAFRQALLKKIEEQGMVAVLGQEYSSYEEAIKDILNSDPRYFRIGGYGKDSLESVNIGDLDHADLGLHGLSIKDYVSDVQLNDLFRHSEFNRRAIAISDAYYGRKASEYPKPDGSPALPPDLNKATDLINQVLELYPLS
jgi:hypothetical protein